MSKSKFNGTDPNAVIQEFGIDATRLLSMADVAPTSPRKWDYGSKINSFTRPNLFKKVIYFHVLLILFSNRFERFSKIPTKIMVFHARFS